MDNTTKTLLHNFLDLAGIKTQGQAAALIMEIQDRFELIGTVFYREDFEYQYDNYVYEEFDEEERTKLDSKIDELIDIAMSGKAADYITDEIILAGNEVIAERLRTAAVRVLNTN